jgi:hypothetical protein
MPITDVFTVRRTRLARSNLRLVLEGRSGQGSTNPTRRVRSTTQKKQLNDMPQLRICEEWRLFRWQNVRNNDAVPANLSNLHDPTHRCGSTG